jgi:hypothetical protein
VNNHQHFASEGFAKTFMDRDKLRNEREEIMKKLLITQLRINNPFPNLELTEYYSPSKEVPSIRTSNPDINKNIFVFKNKKTGEIKPYEIMFFSKADPVQQCTLDRLSNRIISNDSNDENDISKLPVRVAFYDGNNKIHVLKEDLPEEVLERLGEFKDLKNVRKGVHDPKDNLFKFEPIALHLRPEIMLNHSFA